jgi:hypothetical protein
MIIVHGIYHFRPKRIAFRNDYCLSCVQPCRSVQIRTFDAAHVFWIPVLPLGFWKRWICTACGRQPDVSTKTRRPFKWAGLFVLLSFSVLFWAAPPPPDFLVGGLVMRIGAPLGAILLLVHLLRTSKSPSREERLKAIPPATDTLCPFCGTHLLILASQCSCPVCGILRS